MAPALRLGGLILIATLGSAAAAAAQAPAPRAPDPCTAPPNRNEPDLIAGLGCATQSNLRAMIANPADLDRGAAPTLPQGDAAFLAAHRHRLGEPKHILDDASSSGGGGSSGPSNPNSSSR